MRRIYVHHSKKALRSIIGNFILDKLRVPRFTKYGRVIRYKKEVSYQVGNDQVIHHAGDPRLGKLKSLYDLLKWYTFDRNPKHNCLGIVPNDKFTEILNSNPNNTDNSDNLDNHED